MKNMELGNTPGNTASLWKIIVLSLMIFIFILAVPLTLNKSWDYLNRKNPVKYVEEFNNDGKVLDDFNHVFVNENLRDHLPHDYDLLEELYIRLELDPDDTIEKARLPYDLNWRGYHTLAILAFITERLAQRIFTLSFWINFIIYPLTVFLGGFLTYLIVLKLLTPFYHKRDILAGLRQKGKLIKVLFSIGTFFGFCLLIYIRKLSQNWEFNPLPGNSFPNFLVIHFIRSLLWIVVFYSLYLLVSFLRHSKAKWLSKIIDWTFLAFVISQAIQMVHSKRYSLWNEVTEVLTLSYNNLLADKLNPYIGFERFLAFGLIIILILSIISFLFFILYKIIHPGKGKFRIIYAIKYFAFIMILSGIFSLVSGRMIKLQSLVEHQNVVAQKNILQMKVHRVSAEVYQWYHHQHDANLNTNIIPAEFTNHLKGRDDFDFTYTWDGVNLESKLEYIQLDGESRTITYDLNAESGDLDIKGVRD